MNSNHLNNANWGEVYCHRLLKVVKLNPDHFNNHCARCTYFQGSNQGRGVECKYEDPNATSSITIVNDPYYQMERMQMFSFLPSIMKSGRRGGMYNLNETEQAMFHIEAVGDDEPMSDEEMSEAAKTKKGLEELLARQDAALLKKLKDIHFDPASAVMEVDVEQHMNADEIVRRWAQDHPYYRGTIVARVSDVANETPILKERGYYVRFLAVDRFDEFGAVAGPQRDQVLRRIGWYADTPPEAPKLDMAYAQGAAVKHRRTGRVGRVDGFSEDRGRLMVNVQFSGMKQALTLDEVEPLMAKAAERDTRGRFAWQGVNSPQPPQKDGDHEDPEVISATEALHRILQSKNQQKHLTARTPEDREAWIGRYKRLWIGDRPYFLTEIALGKLDARPVDFNEETVQKYVENFPDHRFPIVAPDTTDHDAAYVILDGNHMVEAARRLDKETIRAYVREDGLPKLKKAGAAVWEEQKHPRDHGKFSHTPGAQGEQKDTPKGKPDKAPEAPKPAKQPKSEIHAQLDAVAAKLNVPKQYKEGEKYRTTKEIEYTPDPHQHDPLKPEDLPLTAKEKKQIDKIEDPRLLQERLEAIKERLASWGTDSARERHIQDYASGNKGKKQNANVENAYPDSDPAATVKVGSIEDLVQGASRFATLKDWYAEFQSELTEYVGEDAPFFKTLLAATSPNAAVTSNVVLALKAYRQIKLGAPIQGYLSAVRDQLERVKAGEGLQGVKIQAFEANLHGDADAITLDMHMTRLFFGTSTPTEPQRRFMMSRIRAVSDRLGWRPAQVQAALWAWSIQRQGNEPVTFGEGLRRLKQEFMWVKDEIAATQAQNAVTFVNPVDVNAYNEEARKPLHWPERQGMHMKAAGAVVPPPEPFPVQGYEPGVWQAIHDLVDSQIWALDQGIALADEVERSHG